MCQRRAGGVQGALPDGALDSQLADAEKIFGKRIKKRSCRHCAGGRRAARWHPGARAVRGREAPPKHRLRAHLLPLHPLSG